MADLVSDLDNSLARLLTAGTRATTIALVLGLGATFVSPGGAVTKVLLTSGLVILLLTPVARVIMSVVAYARCGDWLFVLCTSTVLALLIGGFVTAFR